jgi:hypothetical protein
MSKRKKLSATSEPVDKAFGVLDEALRATGRLLAANEDDVRCSEVEIDLEGIELPESLRDPMGTLERGRHILEHGFSTDCAGPSLSMTTCGNLSQAARNGQAISGDLQQRMHHDRNAARNEKKKA